jgi:ABC-type uncharacterized transport system involved in gliding motility auxiliary subunit
MNRDWMTTRQTRFTAYVTLYTLIVLGVLVLANFLANRYNKSYDSTSNKRFSLSDQTDKVVKGLKQDVKVVYFDKPDAFSRAKDLLDRYDNLSTKLSVDYVDPDKKPGIAKQYGAKNYGAIIVEAGNRREEARSLSEEEVTGAIIRLFKGGERTVCAVQGSGEHSFDEAGRSGYSKFKETLERNTYKTKSFSLLDKPEVPKECTVVLVGGPRFDYVDPVLNALKNYVQGGGRLMLFVDPPLKIGREEVANNAGLMKLLESWGVTAQPDLVLDTSGVGQIFGLSEVVPLVTTYEAHAIVRDMKNMATAFPLSRALDVKAGDKTKMEKLLATSDNSYATTRLDNPNISLDPKKDQKGPFTLAAAGSYDTGKQDAQGRLVVVGSSNWVANNILGFNGNRDLALNMVNWLTSDEDLISIRPKDPEDRRLQLTVSQMRVLMWLNLIMIPLCALAAGISVWWRRR